jgi:hypothetical protein
MCKLRALLLVSFLICSPFVGKAQNSNTLQPGTPVERTLGPGQGHEFTVTLEQNYLIQVVVEQRGIDVIVKVSSPAGKSVGEFDSPTGADGSENISFVGVTPGAYLLRVEPLDPKDATTGQFQIRILELRRATEQELKAARNFEAVKVRGLELLTTDIEGMIAEIKSPHTRIRAQLQAALLLWDTDQKRASKHFSDVLTGMKEFFASFEPDNPDFQRYSVMSQLRFEIIQVLAGRDPDAALNFLHATNQANSPFGNQRDHSAQETVIELAIADQISKKDPKLALEIARKTLKTRYSMNLLGTISHLRQKNPEMATELASEIVGKLLNEKLIKSPEASHLAANLIRFSRRPERKIQHTADGTPLPRVAILPEDKYNELLQKMLDEGLSYSPPSHASYTPERDAAWTVLSSLKELGQTLETIKTGSIATIEKKLAQMNSANDPNFQATQEFQKTIATSTVDASLEAIEKAPAELKEQLYMQLANQAANNGDVARARQILNDHIANPQQRRHALANIDQQEMYRAMNAGKVEDALRTISTLRTSKERGSHLAQIANQIGPGHKRAAAMNLLEQARALLNPSLQAQDQEQMTALLAIARAFARYDIKRAFEIVDPLIEQFNEISAAARKLEGFGPEYYEDEELNLQNGNTVGSLATQLSNVLGGLALIDFDRAKATADKLRLPEVRLRAYLDIAHQTIGK